MKRIKNHALVLVVIASLLSACGGDGDEQGQAAMSKGSIATITFKNGEALSTSVFCNLEPQMVADQEILYTATSTRNPYFDVTVFGPNSMFEGGKVSWVETPDFEQYQVNWESRPALSGDSFTVSLEGKTIRGSGTLIRGKDEAGKEGEKREFTLVVNCAG